MHQTGEYPYLQHPFNGPLSRATWMSRYRKDKTNLDYWSKEQWVAVASAGHMQICTSLQTDNHDSTLPLSFLWARCPSCHPTNTEQCLLSKHWRRSINNCNVNCGNCSTCDCL